MNLYDLKASGLRDPLACFFSIKVPTLIQDSDAGAILLKKG